MWCRRHIFRIPWRSLATFTAGRALLPFFARESTPRDKSKGKIYLWGDRAALPGGAHHQMFNDSTRWKCITFGPSFGAAVDNSGEVYLWGQAKDGSYLEPFNIAASGATDCYCTTTDLYILTRKGEVQVIRDLPTLLDAYHQSDDLNSEGTKDTENSPADENPSDGEHSTLNHNGAVNNKKPEPEALNGLRSKRIVKMDTGNHHAAFIDSEGNLYCTGDNSFGQCGTKPNNLQNPTTFVVFPVQNNDIPDVVDLNKVNFKDPNTKIVDLVCGGRHTCCLDSNGNIYTFGDDSSVQLFLGDTRGRTILELDQYKAYARRRDQTTKSYTRYSHKDKHLQFNPIPVTTLGKLSEYREQLSGRSLALAAGNDFTIVATTTKDQSEQGTALIPCGDNRYGQCATADFRLQRPRRVELAGKLMSEKLTCGRYHCLAAMTNGTILGWGSNQHQQLGIEKNGKITSPTTVTPPVPEDRYSSQEERYKINFIRCSFNNTAVILGT